MPTRKTKAARRAPRSPAAVTVAGRTAPLSTRAVMAAVRVVLAGERRGAAVSISFVGPTRMRRLHRTWKGADRPTDVLTFTLRQPEGPLLGDLYVCPAVVRGHAREHRVPVREEMLRVVIHATLHALGYDHPDGDGRTRSAMWRKQERYLACVI
ncbi:MAG: rRNA maturation RNase YbeY [Gemmatimonadales bacterium]